MTVHVFTGPSLAPAAPGAVLHPPVEHGALYRIDLAAGDAVLLVDGVYQHRAPVRHKEILAAAAHGVAVYGAASIGALRACELDGHGVVGLGHVYGWYRDGRLDSDADVALLHGDADVDFRAFTHAVVSVLGALDALRARGRITSRDAEALLAVTRGVHFTERSTRALLAAAGTLAPQMEAVLATLAAPDGDVKRTDAAAAVRAVLARHAAGPAVPAPGALPDTSYRREWELEHRPAAPGGPTRRRVLGYAQLFLPDYPQVHARHVLASLRPEHPAVAASAPDWLAALDPSELVARGLLTADEARGPDADERARRLLVRSFRLRSGRLVYEEPPAELRPRWAELTAQATRMLGLTERAVAANPRFHPADVATDLVLDAVAALWRVPDVSVPLLDRGFRDVDDLVTVARPYFVAAKAAVAMTATRRAA